MNNIFQHAFLSAFVVNFVALNIFLGYSYIRSEYKYIPTSIYDYLQYATPFFTIGWIIALFFAMIIGWPLYWLALKFKKVNFGTTLFGGVFTAIIPFLLLKILDYHLPFTISPVSHSNLIIIIYLATCGSTGGILFYNLHITAKKKAKKITF